MKHVLFNNTFFPTMYAKWRMTEIKAFIEYYKCDIGVLSVYTNYKDQYSWDYEECKLYYNLEEYNILIFQKQYNYLNKFNNNFDGTIFNLPNKYENLYPFCYMFVRKDRPITINWYKYIAPNTLVYDFKNYDLIYHIFLGNFEFFDNLNKFPYEKQAIRLYPGGGIDFNQKRLNLDNKIKLITTNIRVTELVKNSNLSNFKQILYGPMIDKNEIIRKKNLKKTDKLNILFSTSGGYGKNVYERKGYFRYINLIKYYKSTCKYNHFNFYCVGDIYPDFRIDSLDIIYTGLLSQKEFNELLINTIDITINLHSGGTDGFPQGIEALMYGCLGIISDPNNFNEKTGLNFINKDEIFIVPYNSNPSKLCDILEDLDKDREKLLKISNKSQKKLINELSYEKQFKGLFKFLDK